MSKENKYDDKETEDGVLNWIITPCKFIIRQFKCSK